MMANLFKGQLKSHTNVKINKNNTISQYIYYKNWYNWQRQPTPFFLFVADISNKNVYWLNVKTTNINYKKDQEGSTVHIPVNNELSNEVSLNNLISNVIIELERDEEEYLKLVKIPSHFEELDKKYNISQDSLKVALEFTNKLFYLYTFRNRIIYYFNDIKGLKRFFLLLKTTNSEIAINLIHDLLDKYSSSFDYFLKLSYKNW